MANDRTIQTSQSSDLATQTIKINGDDVPRSYQIASLSVAKEINRIASAKLCLLDGEAATSEFNASNSDLFIPGNEIEILSGYHSEEESIFKGVIVKQSIKIRKEGSAKLLIECRDKAHKMTLGRKSRYFYESTDADIIEEIAGAYDVTPDVAATDVTHAELVQYDISDWDFIISRAEMSGLFCMVDDGNLIVQEPDLSQDPVLIVEYGSTMLEFDAEIDARNQFSTVKTTGWDPANQELVEVESTDPGLDLNGNLSTDELYESLEIEEYTMRFGGIASQEVLQAWSDGKLLRDRISKTRGRAQFQGISTVKPNTIVELKGVGDRFNGNAFVSGIFHSISNGQWTTDVQFGINPDWFSKKVDWTSRYDEVLPCVKGLQIGIVGQLEEDPEGEDRVLVKLPVIDPNDEGIWARLSCIDAGAERGTFFRPEVDDEVIVGFVNDDPLNAVVLGMLHSSAKPTPQAITAENNEKGFITRSEMKFLFDDDKKSITLETPAGKKIVIDEDDGSINMEDENGNKVLLNSDGVTIESASDLNLKASGDINLEGTNITASAQANFKGEGSAGAELSSGATVTVQGSLVQIN